MREGVATRAVHCAFACLVTLLSANCTAHDDDLLQADLAFRRFHEALDRKDYKALYQTSHQLLKQTGSEAAFVRLLEDVSQNLGQVRTFERERYQRTDLIGQDNTIDVTYRVTFERAVAKERFVWRVIDGHLALVGYYINSPLLESQADARQPL